MSWNIETAARTLWQEARGEPLSGQKAVAHVIVNRMKDGRWGRSLAEVCLWHMQFSGWRNVDPNFGPACRMDDDETVLLALGALVQSAIDGEPDPTNGATHYFALSIPAPAWVLGATQIGRFGNQMFFKDVK